jgi:SAM-dependent methyltransferase
MEASFWKGMYAKDRKVWGDEPSETARAAMEFVRAEAVLTEGKRLLDIGCGYGRDIFTLTPLWKCRAVGVDPAAEGIALAQETATRGACKDVEFHVGTIPDAATHGTFDFVLAANLYMILRPAERAALRETVPGLLAPGGFLFLGTHSVRDPELAGQGEPVPGDPGSTTGRNYVHLSPREELETAFPALRIRKLYEWEFFEPRNNGPDHHHIAWILVAQKS